MAKATTLPTTDLANLATEPLWQALLHRNNGAIWHEDDESLVNDPSFFLAPNGKQSALAELKADAAAFQQLNDKTRCRFPARYRFLAKRLGWQDEAPFAACPDYLSWRRGRAQVQAELAFFEPDYSNPVTVLGHVGLLLEKPSDTSAAVLIHFFALPSNDFSLVRYTKGMIGKINAVYFLNPVYGAEYSSSPDRGLWRYKLSLTPEETERLVDHAWEVKNTLFKFYFLDENCLFRAMQLLQVARPSVPLLNEMKFTWTPVEAIRLLQQKGFITAAQYVPSQQTQVRWQASLLPRQQQRLARRLANPKTTDMTALAKLEPAAKTQVAQLALAYRHYQDSSPTANERVQRKQRDASLQAYAQEVEDAVVPTPVAPELGHDNHLVALAAGQRDGYAFTDLTLRQLQHDWLDNSAGFTHGKTVQGLGFATLRYYHDKPNSLSGRSLRLQSLRLVDIRNLQPRDLFFKPLSSFISFGAEQVPVEGERLAVYAQGGLGLAWQWGGLMPYAFLKARFEHNNVYAPFVASGAGSELGLLYYHGRLNAELAVDGVYFSNDEWRSRAHLAANWALGRNAALRLKWQHERYRGLWVNEWSLGVRHYFE